jgi:cytidine deaminase
MSITESEVAELVDAATAVRAHAYAPYSRHHVGASVLTADGSVFAGANMETVTLQASVHAERAAIVAMANAGHRRVRAVCVVGPYSGIPCSECRQTLWEFCGADPDVVVVSAPTDGPRELLTMGAIQPFPYGPETKGIDPTQF